MKQLRLFALPERICSDAPQPVSDPAAVEAHAAATKRPIASGSAKLPDCLREALPTGLRIARTVAYSCRRCGRARTHFTAFAESGVWRKRLIGSPVRLRAPIVALLHAHTPHLCPHGIPCAHLSFDEHAEPCAVCDRVYEARRLGREGKPRAAQAMRGRAA